MENKTTIKCPKCQNILDVNAILYEQLENELKARYAVSLGEEQKKYEKKAAELQKEKELIDRSREEMNERIAAEVKEKIRLEKDLLTARLKKEIEEEESEKYNSLQKELNDKSEKLKLMKGVEAEIEKLKREKDELRETIEAESQKKINETLAEERGKIEKTEKEKHELELLSLQKRLDDQIKLTEEMSRKQKQGSMQLQGEVQELAIEDFLKASFPLDRIEEIKKGAIGADCIQTVNTHNRQNCGKILYESKRTKAFGGDWIERLKSNMRSTGIHVGILVTQTMPKEMERMGLKDGIWICNFGEFKGLSAVIRETVIQFSEVTASQENKGEKMTDLYDYLISPEFKSRIEAIVEGFTSLKSELDAEKNAMLKIWTAREKHIEKVITNTISMYGSIKGIAGNAIGNVQALELGSGIAE